MSNYHEIIGILHKKLPIITTTSGFEKLGFVIKTEEQYPQTIQFDIFKRNFEILDKFNIGDNINVKFNLRGFEWVNPEGKSVFINSYICFKIDLLYNGYKVPTEQTNHNSPIGHTELNFPPAEEVFGDLPLF